MAMVETTFTVQTQTYVDTGSTAVKIDYLRTWRELYRQIAAANIGWTLEVTTDTLTNQNSGTFVGKMHHTATGLWYNCFSNNNGAYNHEDIIVYTAANKSLGYFWLAIPTYFSSTPGGQNVYFVDGINGGVFQECRVSQGSSYTMWRIAQGELIDGTIEGYIASISAPGSYSSASSSIISSLCGYSDMAGSVQTINFTGIAGTVGGASQLYIGRCYGVRSSQTNGVTVTWGGKKTWHTGYPLMPKATYSINNVRYTALSEHILLEE